MTIEIRDRTFKVELVNNYCHKLYGQIVDKARAMTALVDSLKEEFERYEAEIQVADKAEAKKLNAQYSITLREVDEQKDKLKAEVAALRDEFILEVFDTNDNLKYDEKWWLHRTDENDLNTFMLQCVGKDIRQSEDKKRPGKK